MKKIGILTSGGDCQGLNAAIRGVGKALFREFGDELELYGIQDGYTGLINGNYKKLDQSDLSGILTLGGTVLGTSRQPYKTMLVTDEINKVECMKKNYKKWELNALVILGGNGTHKTANLLSSQGLNVVTLPKTIDNDIYGTDITFGFQSACDVATQVIDYIHTTADSHGRIFVVEVMGHKVGWLTLYAGIAGGADVILLPEIPYDVEKVVTLIKRREREGKDFSIIAVAEGAISKDEAKMKKREIAAKRAEKGYPSVAYKLMDELNQKLSREIRVAIPGHIQRGGSPDSFDRVLCTRLGAAAAELIKNNQFGYMVSVLRDKIVPVPLSEVAGKLKTVPADCDVIAQARSVGICFGD